MLPAGKRRRWYDGWQLAFGFSSLLGALTYLLHSYPPTLGEHLFAMNPELVLFSLGPGIITGLCWFPIAYFTWEFDTPTEPGVD